MKPKTCLTWPALLAFLLVVPLGARAVGAEDEPTPGIDVKGHLDPIGRTLEGLQTTPRDGGHDGRLGDAWKEYLKRRAPRMRRRVKDLRAKSLWNSDAETRRVLGVKPTSWTSFIKDAATLHTELGECEEGYRKTRVTPDRALWFWKRRNPGPDPIGRVPGEDALFEVERTIREFQAQGLPVPIRLWNSRNRLLILVQEEQERAREQKRREYEERQQQAAAEIARSVDATRVQLAGIADELAESRRRIRALVSTAQEIEEQRLRTLAEATSEDPTFRREVDKLLTDMAKGRDRALNFDDSRHSKYRGDIQQRWLLPRGKLRKLIEKAGAE